MAAGRVANTARLSSLLALLIAASWGCALERRPPEHPRGLAGSWQVVNAGDTIDSIAARAGVPVEDLLEINGLARGAELRPGQMLFVLEAGPAVPPGGSAAPPALAVHSVAPAGGPAVLRWPLGQERTLVGSHFGMRDGRRHEGIDLPAPVGTPVYAAADGQVAYAGNRIRGYGNMVVIRHAGELMTVYAHNSMLLVSQGQPVRAGDRIALVGQSGRATGPHLHFEVRVGQSPHDPMRFLR